MRKLEYLRSAVRKCSTIDEVEKIDLPDDFRLSDDIGECPNLAAIPVEKNGKVWLRIFITHSRIVERKLLLRDSGFTYTREERLSEIYMVPISKEFKLESPIKSDSTEDYSNWGMTKEGTPCIHPTDANFLDYVPMPAVVPFPDHFIVEHYIMHHDGKLHSSLAEAAKYIYSRR